jgi:GT2 family glycosyltransferase
MKIIKNKENLGFAGGNNVGIEFVLNNHEVDYIFLLNNDTIVDSEFLNESIKSFEVNEKIGIVGSKILYYNNPDKIQSEGGKINFWTGRLYYFNGLKRNTNFEVDVINGCGFLVKKEVFNEIGLLDPSYFLYYEETDYCIRAKKRNICVICNPNSKIYHKIHASSGGAVNNPLIYYWTRNQILFMRKNASLYHWITFPTFFIFICLFRIVKHIRKMNIELLKYMVKGVIDGVRGKGGKL